MTELTRLSRISDAAGLDLVADEVRELAERSQRETRAISDLIRAVQAGTRDAVAAMEAGSEKVELGAATADRAGLALGEILAVIQITDAQVTGIAGTVQRSPAGTQHISASAEEVMAQVADISEQAQQLSEVAEGLRALLSRSKLDKNDGADQPTSHSELRRAG